MGMSICLRGNIDSKKLKILVIGIKNGWTADDQAQHEKISWCVIHLITAEEGGISERQLKGTRRRITFFLRLWLFSERGRPEWPFFQVSLFQ